MSTVQMTQGTVPTSSGSGGMTVVDYDDVLKPRTPSPIRQNRPKPQPAEVFRAIYFSHTRVRLSDQQLDAIMADLHRRNAVAKLSGLLLYKSRSFFEVIEGRQDIVMAALDRIFRDTRHFKMKIVLCRAATERQFDTWSMGFRRLDGSVSRAPCYFNLTRRDLEARFPNGAGGLCDMQAQSCALPPAAVTRCGLRPSRR